MQNESVGLSNSQSDLLFKSVYAKRVFCINIISLAKKLAPFVSPRHLKTIL